MGKNIDSIYTTIRPLSVPNWIGVIYLHTRTIYFFIRNLCSEVSYGTQREGYISHISLQPVIQLVFSKGISATTLVFSRSIAATTPPILRQPLRDYFPSVLVLPIYVTHPIPFQPSRLVATFSAT